MIKLLKYLKKYTLQIILIIILLVIQAYSDLSLPQYTSDIVNVGIQQGGVEYGTPMMIRESSWNNLLMFMGEEKEWIRNKYQFIQKDNLDETRYQEYKKKYPIIDQENVYELISKDGDTFEELEPYFIQAYIGAFMLQREQTQDFVFQEGMEEQIPEMMIQQMVVAAVKAEYEAIGINMNILQRDYTLLAGAKMLGLALISMVATILVGYIAAKLAANLGKNFRRKVFRKVVSFSNYEFDHFSTASLITRSTNDIQQVQTLMVFLLRIVFYAPILGIGGVIKALQTNTSMAWIIAVGVMALLTLVLVTFAIAMPKFKLMQELLDKLNLVAREILTGLSVIRAFSTQNYEEKRFDKANQDLVKTNLFVNRTMAFMMPLMMLIMNLVTVLIIWNGAAGVDLGTMQVGDLMAFIQYTMQIIMAFFMISMVSIMLPRASVSAERIVEILEKEPSVEDPAQYLHFKKDKKGYLEFKEVSFRYPNAQANVLSNISFTAKPGETTAIIGSTGSGKSTLINLIPRFYDVTEGEILVDGVDIRRVSQYKLREKLGYVPQQGVLFSGTIDSNIRYGRQGATEEEIERAARIAQAEEFIREKEEGYDSSISQGGSNVSGGQKQRLSIARAIVKKPDIYIFDDSFSALDYKTDVRLRKALREEISHGTMLIVAQRISTIFNADQILVLDEGKIVGKGTHKELLRTCEVYKQIALSQLSKEELEYE